MKLWKKIVLIASTLIVVISSMVLPCFAGTYYSGDYDYTEINTIAPEITWYTEANTLALTEEIYSAVIDTGLITNEPTRQSQSWRNETSLYRLKNSTNTNPKTKLKHLDIYNTETIQGHILSTYNITQIGSSDWATLSEAYMPFSELKIKLNNYVFDGLQNAYIYIPTVPNQGLRYEVTYEAERIVFNRDSGEVYTENASVSKVGYATESNKYIYMVKAGDIELNNIRVIEGGNEREYQSDFILFKSISVKLLPNGSDKSQGWTSVEGLSITIPSNVTYTNNDSEELKRYVNPNDINRYQESILEIIQNEEFFVANNYVTANFSSLWTFLTEAISGFFNFELIPNITIGEIFATIFIILIGIVLLKIFAGG